MADGLVLPDRLAEGLALLGVGERILQRGRGHPQRPDATWIRPVSRPFIICAKPCPAHRRATPSPVRGSRRRPARRLHALVAQLGQIAGDASSPAPCSTSSIVMPLWAGWPPGSVLHSTAISPERRALLIQVFAPSSLAVAVAAGDRGHGLQVRAAGRFGQRHRGPQLAGGQRGQVAPLLLLGAEGESLATTCARPSPRPGSSSPGPAPR